MQEFNRNIPVGVIRRFSFEEGCLLSILECFCLNSIKIPEIPIVNEHYSSQSNKERLLGNVTLNRGSHSCNSSMSIKPS